MATKMAISGNSICVFFFLLFVSSFFLPKSYSLESDDRVTELLHLQSTSKSGVIHLDDTSLRRFLSPKPRTYSLIIFFDAFQLRDKTDLHLEELRAEFDLVASAYVSHNKDSPSQSKVFFFDIEFKESQASFHQFGVNSLPHLRHIGPNQNPKDSDAMDQSGFSRMAESMAEFVEAKTKQTVGPIVRPPLFSHKQIGFMILCLLISAPFVIKRILSGETILHDPKIWLSFAIFVYFFSVSGAMHNIIRKMPMFLSDRNDPTKIVFFYQGSGMQLGAEGFAIGFLYTIVGLMLGFATHFLIYVRNSTVQRAFMFIAILVSFWAVRKVIYLDNWKTGYGIHGFWPNTWK